MVDLFEEVEEQLRSDRYLTLVRQLAPWVTGLFALVLLGYLGFWGFKFWQDRNLATATSEYQNGVDALGQNDPTGAFVHFQAAAKTGAPAYKALALMQEGGIRLAAGKNEEASKLYDAAGEAAPNPIFADLAKLKAAEAILDTAPYPQLQTRLAPLADSKRPYFIYAKEALAMAQLLAAKTADARKDARRAFEVISLTLGAPDDVRQRAQLAMALIDAGEAPTAVAAVKAAATLPPPPPPSVAPASPDDTGQGGPPQPPAGDAQ